MSGPETAGTCHNRMPSGLAFPYRRRSSQDLHRHMLQSSRSRSTGCRCSPDKLSGSSQLHSQRSARVRPSSSVIVLYLTGNFREDMDVGLLYHCLLHWRSNRSRRQSGCVILPKGRSTQSGVAYNYSCPNPAGRFQSGKALGTWMRWNLRSIPGPRSCSLTVLQQAGRLPGCTRTADSFPGTVRDAQCSHRCSRSTKMTRLGGCSSPSRRRSGWSTHKGSHSIQNLRYSTMTYHSGAGKSRGCTGFVWLTSNWGRGGRERPRSTMTYHSGAGKSLVNRGSGRPSRSHCSTQHL